ncbi:MAG: lamin tail domain-containing protein [Bacteroidetes bacterium]|nr:lamin tail domain-containing protein [Bacteroidota bacterium]
MKKLCTLLLVLSLHGAALAQCTELFWSEYSDGAGNDKYLEIFNPTAGSIDLSEYAITRFRNGGTLTDQGVCSNCWVTPLQGTLASGDVFVVMNGQVDDVPIGGGSTSPGVNATLRTYADFFDCTTPYLPGGTATLSEECYGGPNGNLEGSVTYMNGDDAIALLKKRPAAGATATLFIASPVGSGTASSFNWDVIDLIGEIGYRPTTAWRSLPGADGKYGTSGVWITARNTLIRKPGVQSGVTTNPNGFNALAQWDTLGRNLSYSLGWHVVDAPCHSLTAAGRHVRSVAQVSFFPNPVSQNSHFVLNAVTSPIMQVVVRDIQGRSLRTLQFTDRALRRRLSAEGLVPGLYLIDVHAENQAQATLKLVVH